MRLAENVGLVAGRSGGMGWSVCLQLAGLNAAYITGMVLTVDGGLNM